MDNKQRILIVGDVNGRLKSFFARIETVNKKTGPFDLVLCVGNFFGSSTETDDLNDYKSKLKSIPIPIYILGPNDELSAKFYRDLQDGDLCPNLTYLGKRGIYCTSSGLKIAYVSGVEADSTGGTVPEWKFTNDDVTVVRDFSVASKSNMGDYRGVDLLVTSQWPAGIKEGVKNGSKRIAWLADAIKPRYHLCALNGEYFEPPPYRNKPDKNTQMELATRFIALADFGNTEKKKHIYALNVMPVEKMRVIELIQKTIDETVSPYVDMNISESGKDLKGDRNSQYFYDMNTYDDSARKRKGQGNRVSGNHEQKRARPSFDQEKCWFCLSSGTIEKHLIISVGEHFYLALAKGPINETHILILSITHIQNASLLSAAQWDELNRFKESLTNFFKDREETIFLYERNYKTGHLQINAIGVDNNVAWKIKHVLEDKSEEHNITLESAAKPSSPADLPQKCPYFVVDLPDDTIMYTKQMKNFPLHFGREIICADNLLNCEEKIDWRQCNLDKAGEEVIVKSFRESFKPYDFTL
ncbi:CWF19-like protein 1 homolog [Toxorhynchites rutilus septentrionalis]|uniref:CWF19-like protein 1 homolog n=1 Tax=Toxorhynchites rutilus septentrionalis TaxID=329112 RepID=UPI002478D8AF|nr:CWF19-like protein 1 homolog [Toxorhynchites rutilus septentrionalis]